eukprot:COSAG02_NODE_65403_length_258_cov_0.647799_1_plen_79_part_10
MQHNSNLATKYYPGMNVVWIVLIFQDLLSTASRTVRICMPLVRMIFFTAHEYPHPDFRRFVPSLASVGCPVLFLVRPPH